MKIEVVRYADTLWGNGQTGNRVAGALEAAGAEVISTGIGYGQHISQDFFDRDGIDAQVYILAPDQLDAVPAKTHHKKILLSFWETPTFPTGVREDGRDWRYFLSAFDELWVTTDFNYHVFAPAHHNVSLVRVPFRPKVYQPNNNGKIRFFTVFDYASGIERKNPEAVIRAFTDAFEEGEAELIVKTRRSDSFVAENESLLSISRSDITFISDALSNEDMMRLECSVDCLISLHRSEGLGLHILDAVSCGMPTIATAFSGNADYMADPRHLLVPVSQLVPVVNRYRSWSPNDFWAEPSHNAAVKVLRYFAKNVELCRDNAAKLAEPVQTQFSPENCGQMMLNRIIK